MGERSLFPLLSVVPRMRCDPVTLKHQKVLVGSEITSRCCFEFLRSLLLVREKFRVKGVRDGPK